MCNDVVLLSLQFGLGMHFLWLEYLMVLGYVNLKESSNSPEIH